jgi:hypothetical protein
LTVAKNFNTTPTALTPSASVAVDCSLANVFTLTPGQAESITASNMVAGQYVDLIILTSGTNSYTLTFSTGFKTPNTTLATGTVTGKYFAIHYISNGSYLIEIGRTSTQTAVGADIAEWYSYAGEKPQPGEIVSISADNTQIEKTDQAYSQQISGVVSTQPAITLGQEPDQGIVMALTGRVPLKVSTKNGQILTGDSITSSTIAGVGMKAVKAGQTVGKALESTNNWTTQSCPAVASLDQINWPDDDGTNPNHPCFTLSDGTMIGKIMVFVNPSWYDPEVYLTDTGNLKIAQVNGNYQLTNTSNSNSVIDTIGAFANVVAANIKAGAITTTDFIAQNITAGAVTTQSLATNSFTAFQGTVDNLLVKSGLVAFNIQTQLISPVPGQTNVAVQIGSEATPSGQFVIQNASGSAVAAIDNLGNATISGQLTTNGASVSGTLYADNIQSKSLDDIQALLTQVETDQNTLKNTVNWNSLTATNSANLDNLAVSDLYITNQAAINSLSVTTSIALGSDLVIGSDNTINTLSAPLKIQSLAMAPVEIMDGLVTIDTKGNVNIAGDLAVAGRVKAAGLDITAAQMTDPNATTSANLLTLQDASGNTVSSVNSSGSAQFNSITTPQLIVAGSADATVAGTIVNGVITTNSTIGTATIPAGTADITIKNPKISDYTLVYVTPTSGTQNNVLYVKEKGTGYFKVGFDQAINTDVSFNWWIVQVSQ